VLYLHISPPSLMLMCWATSVMPVYRLLTYTSVRTNKVHVPCHRETLQQRSQHVHHHNHHQELVETPSSVQVSLAGIPHRPRLSCIAHPPYIRKTRGHHIASALTSHSKREKERKKTESTRQEGVPGSTTARRCE